MWSQILFTDKVTKFPHKVMKSPVKRESFLFFVSNSLHNWIFQYNKAFILAVWISVYFSHSVVSNSLRPHEPKHARPPCPSSTPGVHPNPCPLSGRCHATISSSVVPCSSCPQSFPASGSFPVSQLFASGAQSIGVSPSASVLPIFRVDFLSDWLVWCPCCPRILKSLL